MNGDMTCGDCGAPMTENVQESDRFEWLVDGIKIDVIETWVDEDNVKQVRVQDGDSLISLEEQDIIERLEDGHIRRI